MFHRGRVPAGDDRSQVGRVGRAAAPYRGGPYGTGAWSAVSGQRAHAMLPILVDHRRATARPVTGRKPRASALTDAADRSAVVATSPGFALSNAWYPNVRERRVTWTTNSL